MSFSLKSLSPELRFYFGALRSEVVVLKGKVSRSLHDTFASPLKVTALGRGSSKTSLFFCFLCVCFRIVFSNERILIFGK